MIKTLLYILFACIAISINLLTQWPFFTFMPEELALYAALPAGTLTGLATKYVLDKRWIFFYVPAGRKDEARCFVLYSLMGVLTTCIFWGTETAFYLLDFSGSQYVGGAIGLATGYTLKYFLDKKFVFRAQTCVFQVGAATRQ